ncbi:MAG: EamA family transporter [Akkermansiaceae bacterium]|nr:EamA family transporter [Akkermansiaceae bacterium]
MQGTAMKSSHIPLIAALGLCLFLNQLLFILGLHLAGVALAACMQPTIPVFTALLSMLCGQEQASTRRVSGVHANARGDWSTVSSIQRLGALRPCCIVVPAKSYLRMEVRVCYTCTCKACGPAFHKTTKLWSNLKTCIGTKTQMPNKCT